MSGTVIAALLWLAAETTDTPAALWLPIALVGTAFAVFCATAGGAVLFMRDRPGWGCATAAGGAFVGAAIAIRFAWGLLHGA